MNNKMNEKPEWDDKMKSVVSEREAQCKRCVDALSEGLPRVITVPLWLFKAALTDAFEGGLEALTHDLK